MHGIEPTLTQELQRHVGRNPVWRASPYPVKSYRALVEHIARLSYATNPRHLLFFRGQDKDFQNRAGGSTLYPAIYRGDNVPRQEIVHSPPDCPCRGGERRSPEPCLPPRAPPLQAALEVVLKERTDAALVFPEDSPVAPLRPSSTGALRLLQSINATTARLNRGVAEGGGGTLGGWAARDREGCRKRVAPYSVFGTCSGSPHSPIRQRL